MRPVKVEATPPGQSKAVDGRLFIAVVIVNYRTPELVLNAIRSVERSRGLESDLQIVIIDNASGDGSADIIGGAMTHANYADWVTFLPQSVNGGFGWGNNQAVLTLAQRDRKPDLVLFLNPDAELQAGALQSLRQTLENHPECGAVGACLTDVDGHAGNFAFRVPSVGREFIRGARVGRLGRLLGIDDVQIGGATEADWVTGAAFMVRWKALQQAGLFDDGYFLYFEEIELMARIRSEGWTVRYDPAALVLHRAGSSTGVDWDLSVLPPYWHRSRRRYFVQALGVAGADRADRAYRLGRLIARLIRRWDRDAEENVRRMAEAAALPLAPRSVRQIDELPGADPAWMATP